MNFDAPWSFWLLLLLPLLGWLFWLAFERGKKDLVNVGGLWRSHRLHLVLLLKTFFSSLAFLAFLAFLVLALAGPSWGSAPSEEGSAGLDVAVSIDVSRSMLCDDQKPTRLARATETLRFLADSLPGARFSVTIFKGQAKTMMPLTQDINALSLILESLNPDMYSVPGTNLAEGISGAASTLLTTSSRNQVLLLVSDGETKDGDVSAAARQAAGRKITILTLGVGTVAGGKIPLTNGDYVTDLFGRPVITSLNRGLLESVAKDGRGAYFGAQDTGALTELLAKLNSLASSSERGGIKLQPVSRYRVFLLLALGCLMVYLFFRIVKWQKVF